eukprot:15059307-Heterocapsa_arctica.AAC.1
MADDVQQRAVRVLGWALLERERKHESVFAEVHHEGGLAVRVVCHRAVLVVFDEGAHLYLAEPEAEL